MWAPRMVTGPLVVPGILATIELWTKEWVYNAAVAPEAGYSFAIFEVDYWSVEYDKKQNEN